LRRQYLGEYHQVETAQRRVRYALERLGILWKRPRPDLSRCSPTWRQAKGGSPGGLLAASARSSSCGTRLSSRKLHHSIGVLAESVRKSASPLLGPARGGSCLACSISPRGMSCSSSPPGGMSKPHQFFLQMIRSQWRGWPIVLCEERGSPHTAEDSRELATALPREVRLLPPATPRLKARDHLWRQVKGRALADRATKSIEQSADRACQHILTMSPHQRLQKAGVLSGNFWLTS